MPTYEYRCPEGHEFELFQRMSDEPVASCPECGEQAERRLSAGAGFLFKGSGFYITDYRSESYRAAEKKESGASSSGEASSTSPSSGSGAGSEGAGTGKGEAAAGSGSDGSGKGKGKGKSAKDSASSSSD